jgi:hypothetical protein
MKIFLSRSTKDKQFVQSLAAELKAEEIQPWLASFSRSGGVAYRVLDWEESYPPSFYALAFIVS